MALSNSCLSLSGIAAIVVCTGLSGCRLPQERPENLLVVNFHEGQILRYEMKSTRNITIELTGSGTKQSQPQKMNESLEMVMAYKPTKVDPFGLTRIECTCESAHVVRSSFGGQTTSAGDAIENIKGKTFILDLSPSGQIEDFKALEALLFEIGKTAFDDSRTDMHIKNSDMIYDFVALQWYLWDSAATVPNPLDGVNPGMTWKSTQLIAWPVPTPNPPCRVTTFKLDSVETSNEKQIAVISSDYTLSDKTVAGFPKPYEGSFQMRGLFGFLRDYKFMSLEGNGKQRFDLTDGIVVSDTQNYKLITTASFLLPLGDSVPHVILEQNISIKRLEADHGSK